MPQYVPSVLRIVPTNNVQNSPCAIAPIASMKYRFPEKTISFLCKNALTFCIFQDFLFIIFLILAQKNSICNTLWQFFPVYPYLRRMNLTFLRKMLYCVRLAFAHASVILTKNAAKQKKSLSGCGAAGSAGGLGL